MGKTKIVIAIPDAGPLISLAKANALDLICSFKEDVEIVITDVVHHEVTNNPSDFPDALAIREFLTRNVNRIRIEPTTYGDLILFRVKNEPSYKFPPDAGEMSITSYVANIFAKPPGAPVLVITEDMWFERHSGVTLQGNIHILSTFAFLAALYKQYHLDIAKDVMDKIFECGRTEYSIDQPAGKIDTEWESQIDEDALSEARHRFL